MAVGRAKVKSGFSVDGGVGSGQGSYSSFKIGELGHCLH